MNGIENLSRFEGLKSDMRRFFILFFLLSVCVPTFFSQKVDMDLSRTKKKPKAKTVFRKKEKKGNSHKKQKDHMKRKQRAKGKHADSGFRNKRQKHQKKLDDGFSVKYSRKGKHADDAFTKKAGKKGQHADDAFVKKDKKKKHATDDAFVKKDRPKGQFADDAFVKPDREKGIGIAEDAFTGTGKSKKGKKTFEGENASRFVLFKRKRKKDKNKEGYFTLSRRKKKKMERQAAKKGRENDLFQGGVLPKSLSKDGRKKAARRQKK